MENIPGNYPGGPGPTNTAAARQEVSTPAILLMVTAGLGVAAALLGFVQALLGAGGIPPEMLNDPNMAQFRPWLERSQSFGVIGNILTLALSGVTFFGALKMKNLENFGLAIAASIIAIIPCFGPCCCIGIPAGIWSLVVLNKPEVKSAFR
ncbi:hypothetical protein JRI60_39515 [Archangium violaceum]|uniref:hypothetical protein n=1 Tax=Archangium violaceum TaxID=83451 RepID=UPI00195074E3|nr:hypothetical protein [Archangium violaceum]QRN95121.1 hypothetical protein JRI60_39515 [Archangium violaceum]